MCRREWFSRIFFRTGAEAHDAGGGFMSEELTGALSGLRPLGLNDLQLYKNALHQVNRICWQQYFPFLYFRYILSRKDDLLISESEGSVCIFLKTETRGAPRLYLFFLPIPLNTKALDLGLERVREFNKSKRAVIFWVDEEDIGNLEIPGSDVRFTPLDREYIYDPGIYRSLSGGEKRHIRKSVNRLLARGDVEVRDFGEGDIRDCLSLMDEWAISQQDKYDGQVSPRGYAKRCVRWSKRFDKKDLFGKVVLVDGKIRSVGFAGEIRTGLANLFVAYSDHSIKELSRYQIYHLLLELEGCALANSAYATTPGLIYAKESLCPVFKHGMYRAHVTR
jgi:hypothetical protein